MSYSLLLLAWKDMTKLYVDISKIYFVILLFLFIYLNVEDYLH